MTPLVLFAWGRVPGTNVDACQWGRYLVMMSRQPHTGAWDLELRHSGKRTRHQMFPADWTRADARQEAESWLMDEQGPAVREMVRRTQGAQREAAGTRAMRAVSAGGKRRHAPKPRKSKRGRRRPAQTSGQRLSALAAAVQQLVKGR